MALSVPRRLPTGEFPRQPDPLGMRLNLLSYDVVFLSVRLVCHRSLQERPN